MPSNYASTCGLPTIGETTPIVPFQKESNAKDRSSWIKAAVLTEFCRRGNKNRTKSKLTPSLIFSCSLLIVKQMTCKPSSKLSLFKAATKPFCANYHVLSTSIVYTISNCITFIRDIDFYW